MAAVDPIAPQSRRFSIRLPIWVCLATTLVAVDACLQIECRNYVAGGILPRDTSGPGNPKWRVAADRSIRANFQKRIKMQEYERIAAAREQVTAEEEAAVETNPRPLTATKQDELERELDENRANSRLRDFVQTW